MKYSIGILVCSILLSFILLSAAASAAEVRIVPKVIDTEVGETFTINVTVDPSGKPVHGAQYNLHFNPTILKAIKQTKGTFLSQDGASTIEVTNRLNNTPGTVEYGETRMGVENGVENQGTLTSITFKVIGTGTSDLNLLDVIVSDPNATSIEAVIINGTCVVGGEETSTNTPTSNSDSEPSSTITPTPTIGQTPTTTPTTTEQVPTITPTFGVDTGKTTTPTAIATPAPAASPTETSATRIPGFEAGISISVLLVISSLVVLKSKRRI